MIAPASGLRAGTVLAPIPQTPHFGPGVAVTPTGFVIAWQGYGPGDDQGIFAQRFSFPDPQIGSLTASESIVKAGASLTLTASNVTDSNPGGVITKVTFYYFFDSSGAQQILGYGTPNGTGDWTLTFTVNLPRGTYTLFAQAEDSFGILSDPLGVFITVK